MRVKAIILSAAMALSAPALALAGTAGTLGGGVAGAVVGGAVAGPVGAVVGGAGGAYVGDRYSHGRRVFHRPRCTYRHHHRYC